MVRRQRARLKDFVDSVLDSVSSIAGGGGAVAGYIEQTLAKTVPMVISGLASLLGLGGIVDKIKKVLETIQKPVMSVVDKLVGTAVKFGKKLIAKLGKKKKEERNDPEAAKALVAQELGNQTVHGAEHAQSLIENTFAKYQPQGMKSLELIPPAKAGDKVTVLAAASPLRRIQMSQDPREVIRLAMSLRSRTAMTTAYVSYDADRPFPANGRPYRNKKGKAGHAEMWLAMEVPQLIKAIEDDRRNRLLRTGPGKRVPVRIDMNRLPCDHCGKDRIISAFAPYSQLVRVEVSAASVWQQAENPNIDFTSTPGIKRLMDANIEVKPLDVWPVVEQKLRSIGIKESYGRRGGVDP